MFSVTIVVLVLLTAQSGYSGRASDLSRAFIAQQHARGNAYMMLNNVTKLYVYDSSGYFSSGMRSCIDCTIITSKLGNFALISQPVQLILTNTNEYRQFLLPILSVKCDQIGCFINKT